MAMINFNQIKGGTTLTDNVNEAVSKSAVINEWSETPSDDLIPSEALLESKVLTTIASIAAQVEKPVTIAEQTNTIVLNDTPTDSKVVLVVNGVNYQEDNAFTVDRTNKTLTWTGDFPLTPDTVDKATVVYMAIKQNNGGSSFPKAKHIVGMVLADEGSRVAKNQYGDNVYTTKGDWRRIDKNYNEVDFDPNHGTWAGIQEVTTSLDGAIGQFVEIPTTWVKNEIIQNGPFAGCNCWWMADGEAPGFHVHPAFIKPDGTPGKLRVGKYMATVQGDENGDSNVRIDTDNDDVYYYFQSTSYNNLRTKALTYNTPEENGYRAYSIYDHHFIARMILTEFGNPNVYFSMQVNEQTHQPTGVWMEKTSGDFGTVEANPQPSETQLMIASDYRGIKSLLGESYANCLLDGLTTLNGTYQLLAADGSGTMTETGIECPQYGIWIANCRMDKVNGVDFGDVFINDGTNQEDDYIIDYIYEDEKHDAHYAKASFCDYQYVVSDRAVYTQYEDEYNYCGLFMLNSIQFDVDNLYYDTMHMCWRLVQVV